MILSKKKIKIYLKHFKKNLILAFPIILTQIGIISINFFNNLIVRVLGKNTLAVISLSNSVCFLLILSGIGISTSISSLIASSDAEKKYQEGAIIIYHSLIINFFYLFLCMVLFTYFFIFFRI